MRPRVAFSALVCLLAVTPACARSGSGPAPVAPTGGAMAEVRGTATVDHGCPVSGAGSPCPRKPLRARILVVAADSGDHVATIESGDDGRFRTVLATGRYELRAENLTGQPVPVAMPVLVTVRAGESVDVAVEFDSGVRGVPAGS